MVAPRPLRALALGLCASVVLVGGAAGAARPSGALSVAAHPDFDLSGVQLASNRSGFSAAIWKTPATAGHVQALRLATRARGGAWSRAITVDSAKTSTRTLEIGRIAVDDHATVHVVWAEVKHKSSTAQLLAATRHAAGRLSTPTKLGISSYTGLIDNTLNGDLAVAPSGIATAVWCQGGVSDNALDTKHPGTVYTRTASPSGRWSKATRLWKGDHCAGAGVQVDAGGDALAVWNTTFEELDESVKLTKLRRAGKPWPAKPTAVTELSDGGADSSTIPFLGAGGVLHLFTFNTQNDVGAPGLRYAVEGTRSTSPTETLPAPTDAQTLGGWIGSGDLQSSTDVIDGSGTPVSVLGVGGSAVPRGGGLGTSALWAAIRSAAGWSITPIDAFAPAADPAPSSESPPPNLHLDASGRVVATWVELGSTTPCEVEVFQSTRADDGTWSPRVLAGVQGGSGKGTSCEVGRGVSALPPASLLWSATSRTLTVQPSAGDANGAPVAPAVQLVTSTWSAIRQAGAIELRCIVAAAGYCHVSLLRAELDLSAFDALEGFCRPTLATTQIAAAGTPGVVSFPLATGCYAGGPTPEPSSTPLSFPVYAVSDVVGHRSASTTTTLTIGAG